MPSGGKGIEMPAKGNKIPIRPAGTGLQRQKSHDLGIAFSIRVLRNVD